MPRARTARVAAQAKINLFLKVLERDDQGYHKLWTLFQRIDLTDDVVVRVGTRDRSLHVDGPRVPAGGLGPPEKNLSWRAAEEYGLHQRGAFPNGFAIEITKNIPVGGGLGGASADAGAVLRALDALAPEPLGAGRLAQIARTLGADVPFMAGDLERAYGGGYGDRISRAAPASELAPADVVLAVPLFGISTTDAYRWLDDDRGRAWTDGRNAPQGPGELPESKADWESMCREGNDFEPVVEKRHPSLRKIRERLASMGAIAARLAGSGSTVFGLFRGPAPSDAELGLDAPVIRTRTSARVVPVETQE